MVNPSYLLSNNRIKAVREPNSGGIVPIKLFESSDKEYPITNYEPIVEVEFQATTK